MTATPAVNITVTGQLGDAEADAALSLVGAAAAADGVAPLSEQVWLHVRYRGDPAARNLLLWRDGELAGFAHLGPGDPDGGRSGELVVHPARRRQGLGLALARAAVAQTGPLPLRLWAHGDLPAAARLAAAAQFSRIRSLWLMRRPLAAPLDEPRFGPGISVRTFARGRDEQDWLALNARAFAGHPEQGRWIREDLDRRESQPWFDPGGFFLAERDGRLAGFHWTKIHPAEGPGGPRTGEVYVIGVDPAEQGTGLGRALALTGLRHLRDQGADAVILYTEADNTAAISLYESLGFAHVSTDAMYEHRPAAPQRESHHQSVAAPNHP